MEQISIKDPRLLDRQIVYKIPLHTVNVLEQYVLSDSCVVVHLFSNQSLTAGAVRASQTNVQVHMGR